MAKTRTDWSPVVEATRAALRSLNLPRPSPGQAPAQKPIVVNAPGAAEANALAQKAIVMNATPPSVGQASAQKSVVVNAAPRSEASAPAQRPVVVNAAPRSEASASAQKPIIVNAAPSTDWHAAAPQPRAPGGIGSARGEGGARSVLDKPRDTSSTLTMAAEELLSRMRRITREADAASKPANPSPRGKVVETPAPAARSRRPQLGLSSLRESSGRLGSRWARAPLLLRGVAVLPVVAVTLWCASAMLGGSDGDARASTPAVRAVASAHPDRTSPAEPPPAPAPASARPAAGPRPNALTLERAAVDAIAEGRYAAAADLYTRLARFNPDNAATWREAARILSERQATTHPDE